MTQAPKYKKTRAINRVWARRVFTISALRLYSQSLLPDLFLAKNNSITLFNLDLQCSAERKSQETPRKVLYCPIFDPLQLSLVSSDGLPISTLCFSIIPKKAPMEIMIH